MSKIAALTSLSLLASCGAALPDEPLISLSHQRLASDGTFLAKQMAEIAGNAIMTCMNMVDHGAFRVDEKQGTVLATNGKNGCTMTGDLFVNPRWELTEHNPGFADFETVLGVDSPITVVRNSGGLSVEFIMDIGEVCSVRKIVKDAVGIVSDTRQNLGCDPAYDFNSFLRRCYWLTFDHAQRFYKGR